MTDSNNIDVPAPPARNGRDVSGWKPISVGRLASKELRETLRDRRTIATLFLMPLLVYPILSLLFQGFIASSISESQSGLTSQTSAVQQSENGTSPQDDTSPNQGAKNPDPSVSGTPHVHAEVRGPQYLYMFESEPAYYAVESRLNLGFEMRKRLNENAGSTSNDALTPDNLNYSLYRQHIFKFRPPESPLSLEELVEQGEAEVGVIVHIPDGSGENGRSLWFELVYRHDNVASLQAVRLFESIIDALNINIIGNYAASKGLGTPLPIRFESVSVARSVKTATISFAALIPLILTLMTITGAVYPAIDLTAGERERGTLESLVAAPIPRMRILLGKLIAIVSVAMLTAVVNLVGMMITIWVFRFDTVLFGEQGLTLLQVFKILMLLVLFAGFFSSVLLVITSFARSFKEGQAYLIPVMMVALAPSLMSLKPDLQLTGIWAVTPLVNIVLLSRDVLSGTAQWSTGLVAIVSTLFYAAMALTMAARFFGTANVLYGQDEGIASVFRRPRQSSTSASASLAMLCLALLFPASFLWQGLLVRFEGRTTEFLLVMVATGLIVVFALIPGLLAVFHRVRLLPGFNLRRSSLSCYLAAILLGLGLGPLLMQAIASSGEWLEYLNADSDSGAALLKAAEEQAQRLRASPWALVMICLAIVPAVCEELFFRGLLFRSLRAAMSPVATIIATGLLFGAFHLITTSGLGVSRVIPTTIMGFALGWICYKSGSVIPGMIFHCLNNMLGLSLAYFRDDLVALEWITKDQNYIPLEILAVALVLSYTGFAILHWRHGVIGNPDDLKEYGSAKKSW